MAVMLVIVGAVVSKGEPTIGGLTAFVLDINELFAPVQQLVTLYTQYQQAKAAIGKIRGLLATPSSVRESPTAVTLPPVEGEIGVDHVTFGYLPARPVLSDIF